MGGGVGWDEEGWVGGEAAMTPTQWATQPVEANIGPHCPIGALHGSHCSSRDSGGLAKCP